MKFLSTSEMSSFKRCPRQWWLSVHRRLVPIEDKYYGARHIGNLTHTTLATYYGGDGTLEQALMAEVDKEQPFVPPNQVEEWGKDVELVKIMIEGYGQWLEEEGEDQDLRIKSTERILSTHLYDDVRLVGKLDAVVERQSDDRSLLFLDHKTTGSFDKIEKTAHMSEQFLSYMLLQYLEQLELQRDGKLDKPPLRADGGIYNMIRKVKRTASAKPPFYKRSDPVRHNVTELRNYWYRVLGVAQAIEQTTKRLNAGEDHHQVAYATPRDTCSWDCDFFAICPMFDDGSDVEGLIPLMYKEADPLKRYKDGQRDAILTQS